MEKVEDYCKTQWEFFTLLSEVYALAYKTDEPYIDIQNLRELTIAWAADNECQLATTTVGQPKNPALYDDDDVPVGMCRQCTVSHRDTYPLY